MGSAKTEKHSKRVEVEKHVNVKSIYHEMRKKIDRTFGSDFSIQRKRDLEKIS